MPVSTKADSSHVTEADLATERMRDQLMAVADAEHRDAQIEHRLRGAGAAGPGHAVGAARQDHRLRRVGAQVGVADRLVGADLAEDAEFTQAARDELRHLAAEIEDQDLVGMNVGHGGATAVMNSSTQTKALPDKE